MRAAIDLADHLNEQAILTMHQALMGRHAYARPGQWRDTQVWIGVSQTAARRAIDQAVDAGVLTAADDKKRNRIWLTVDVLALLDDFADRAGRCQ